MAKELEAIISGIDKKNFTDTTTNKGLKELAAAITAAGADEAKKKTAQEAYDKQYNEIVKLIDTKVNEEIETDKLEGFSAEVKARRKDRGISKIEGEVKMKEGDIDLLTMEVADIDKEIEEIRKGIVPVKP